MVMTEEMKTAIRMVGHLLDHYPTLGALARNKEGICCEPCSPNASCWCFVGATNAVASKLNVNASELLKAAYAITNCTPTKWDNYGKSYRQEVAKKLQSVE